MNDHEQMQERIAADSLAAEVDQVWVRTMLDHLVECHGCRELYRGFRETAADLALAAAPAAISAAFEQRVLAATADRARPGRRRSRRIVGSVVAMSLAAAAVTGVAAVRIVHRAERAERIIATIVDASARTIDLQDQGTSGSVSVVVTRDGRAVMVGSGLRIDEGKLLVLWLIAGNRPQRIAIARPHDGDAVAAFTLAASGTLALTIEDGVVDAPTTEPIFAGSFNRREGR